MAERVLAEDGSIKKTDLKKNTQNKLFKERDRSLTSVINLSSKLLSVACRKIIFNCCWGYLVTVQFVGT
jgi:hypothetical protein